MLISTTSKPDQNILLEQVVRWWGLPGREAFGWKNLLCRTLGKHRGWFRCPPNAGSASAPLAQHWGNYCLLWLLKLLKMPPNELRWQTRPRPDTSNHYLASVAIENNQLGCWKSRKLALCGRPGVGGRGWPGVGGGALGWALRGDTLQQTSRESPTCHHLGHTAGGILAVTLTCPIHRRSCQGAGKSLEPLPPFWPTGIPNRPISDCDTGDL